MILLDIKLLESGFSANTKGLYIYNKSASVHFEPNTELPKDTDNGRWEFYDEDGSFEQIIAGSFITSVKKAIDIHKNRRGSSFSNSLKVRKSK